MFELSFRPSFTLGSVAITATAARRLSLGDVTRGLRRHAEGDHGDFAPPSARRRRGASVLRQRRLSAFRAEDGTRFWIITDPEPVRTTVLLPEDD